MKDLEELGLILKRDAPGAYDQLSNTELARRVKAKNPDLYQEYTDNDTLQKVRGIMSEFNTGRGIFGNLFRRWKAVSQNNLLEVVGKTQMQLVKQAADLADAVISGKKKEIELEMFLAQHIAALSHMENTMLLADNAAHVGLTLEAHQLQLQSTFNQQLSEKNKRLDAELTADLAKLQNKFTIKGHKIVSEVELAKLALQHQNDKEILETTSRLKIEESRIIGDEELRRKIFEANEAVRLSIMDEDPEMAGLQKQIEIQEMINRQYKIIADVRKSEFPEDLKLRMIEDAEDLIKAFKQKLRLEKDLAPEEFIEVNPKNLNTIVLKPIE